MNYRRPDLEIRPWFVQQLAAYELRLTKNGLGPKTTTWEGIFQLLYIEVFDPSSEEIILRNTYINALLLSNLPYKIQPKRKKAAGLKWANHNLATVIPDSLPNKEIVIHKIIQTDSLKPIIAKEDEQESINNVVENTKENFDKYYQDTPTIPIPKNIPKSKKSNKKEINKMNFIEKKYKNEILDIVDSCTKHAGESNKIHDEVSNAISNTKINNIIIQNPQNVELNTYIARTIIDNKKSSQKNKKVILNIHYRSKDHLVQVLRENQHPVRNQ